MGKINWGRVLACGLLIGVVSFGLGALIFAVWGKDFETGMQAIGRPFTVPKAGWPVYGVLLMNLALGIVTIWLYAAIRPRYGPGPKTAAVTGFAMWLILALADAFYMALGLLPTWELELPLGASLLGIIAATEVGAVLYKE